MRRFSTIGRALFSLLLTVGYLTTATEWLTHRLAHTFEGTVSAVALGSTHQPDCSTPCDHLPTDSGDEDQGCFFCTYGGSYTLPITVVAITPPPAVVLQQVRQMPSDFRRGEYTLPLLRAPPALL